MRTAALACAAVLIAGCGSGSESGATGDGPSRPSAASSGAISESASATAAAPGSSVAAPVGTVITVALSQYGPVLFDGSGQAIYTFGTDKTGPPTCYADCARAWPPVLTTGGPAARGGVRAELLGVTSRRDGSSQVTYAGKPLYFYGREGKHVVLCHNVREFGGLWLAITETGSAAPTGG
jgi:predicted lipoprotein with Yx(FWY)xxD motif